MVHSLYKELHWPASCQSLQRKRPAHTHLRLRAQTQYQGLMSTMPATGKATQTRKENWGCHRTEEMESSEASDKLGTYSVTNLTPLQIKPKTLCALCVKKYNSVIIVPEEKRSELVLPVPRKVQDQTCRESQQHKRWCLNQLLAHLYFTINSPQADK